MKYTCKECGGENLQWDCTVNNKSDVQDGRLRAHDMDTLFYLGCNDCSAKVTRATGDQIAQKLNRELATQVA